MSFTSEVLADSPAGFWMLNDPSGNAVDLSGNGRHGTYVGTPTRGVTGINGNLATQFDGVNDEVTVAANTAFWPSAGQGVTIEAWYKGTAVGSNTADGSATAPRGLVCASTDASNKRWVSSIDASGKIRVHNSNDYELTGPGTGPAINDGTYFHQVVWTITASTYNVELFIDGVSRATNTVPDDAGLGSPLVRIGKHDRASSNHYLSGVITGVAIFSSVLSSGRISAHYAAGVSVAGAMATETDIPISGSVFPITGVQPRPMVVVV